ncbi:MAG TPA: prolipoprotein diacylglyceryl transferase [Phycisphaerae bacterium]|jgi:phosphatidylglycerol:prolipoprotein diacylglycerol transferase|nr:prolipoprotein diacylglyceryl transferase [Phycisphaerae bacterium]HOB75951.1 prolipoprotein diacylglyceryl transferase [Phycisphaerae bacterium]HOJ55557.1 prolipoprotein diacylglyceryl transferase [Phycisphaerae bacterium]HOL27589.1 prolipoprotein diacylglyceryl transferase [Phycisphaerae bacterium]HPP21831.1 prolipoprotein diacylglyceryl transferase [Phycisphaerae bacterium]
MWPTIIHLELPFWPHEFDIRSYGLMLMIGFLGGTWWAARRAQRVKANPELVVNCGFVALIAAIVGARLFYVIHYWDQHFAGRGFWAAVNITAGGMEFYGGFLGAVSALLVYLWWNKASWRLYLDIFAPSLAFGLAVTRVGCFLNGCCWGGVCPEHLPWAVHFPYGSAPFVRQWDERTVALPAEFIYVSRSGTQAWPINPAPDDPKYADALAGQARKFGRTPKELVAEASTMHSSSLHPAQLYASINAALLAFLLSVVFYRRKRQGIVLALFLTLYPIMRVFEEIIRMDNPHDTAGLTISQFVSVLIFVTGVSLFVILRRLPLRSPKAVPYVPPWEQEEAKKPEKPKERGKRR